MGGALGGGMWRALGEEAMRVNWIYSFNVPVHRFSASDDGGVRY